MNKDNSEKRKAYQKYSRQFKDQALEWAEKVGVTQTAKDLGISASLRYSWRVNTNKAAHL